MENYELKYRDALIRECWMWLAAIVISTQTLNVLTDYLTKDVVGFALSFLMITTVIWTLAIVRAYSALREVCAINHRNKTTNSKDDIDYAEG